MYLVYYSQKNIPWINPSLSVYPTVDITDSFFDFSENINGQAVYFETYERARIVVNDLSYKYFKIEKIENGKVVEETYWYTNSISKILSNGIEVEIKLDYFMTYILKILKQFKKDNLNVLMDRATINDTLLNNETYKLNLLQGMSKEDDLFESVEKKYNESTLYVNSEDASTPEYRLAEHRGRQLLYILNGNKTWKETDDEIITITNSDWVEKSTLFRNTYYFVFRNKWGKYMIFPILGVYPSRLRIDNGVNTNPDIHADILYYNRYSEIFNGIVNRTSEGMTDLFDSNSFLGIFPAPIFDLNQNKEQGGLCRILYKNTNTPFELEGYLCYIFEPNFGLNATLYHHINVYQNLIDRYINYYEPIYYAGEEIKPIDYFISIEKSKLPYVKFRVLFNDGFKGIVNDKHYLNFPIVDFGGNLPSADNTYHEQARQININRNTGLVAAAGNIAWGLGAKNFEGAAIKTFSNLYKLAIEIPQQRRMLKHGFISSSTNDMNSMNKFSTFINLYFANKSDSELIKFNRNKGFSPYIIKNTFTDDTKNQLKQILKWNGFSINSYLGFADFIDTVKNEEYQFFKINEEWLKNNLDYIQKHEFIPPVILETIIDMFNEGIRMKKWV